MRVGDNITLYLFVFIYLYFFIGRWETFLFVKLETIKVLYTEHFIICVNDYLLSGRLGFLCRAFPHAVLCVDIYKIFLTCQDKGEFSNNSNNMSNDNKFMRVSVFVVQFGSVTEISIVIESLCHQVTP